jgi:putative ABC transport system permease protein
MKISLAYANLVQQKSRTGVALAGVATAVTLVFMQLGFRGAVEKTATRLYDQLDFDLLLVSKEYVDINHASGFPRSRLEQAESVGGVVRAVPAYVGFNVWQNPRPNPRSRPHRTIMIVAFRPTDRVFKLPDVTGAQQELTSLDTVLMDRSSRRDFGPQVGPHGEPLQTELGTTRVKVVGRFTLGTGFAADGLVLAGDQTYSQVLGGRPLRAASLGLITLEPGVSARQVADELGKILPKDVRVCTRAEIAMHERQHWLTSTAVGIIFSLGVAVALIVGAVFMYQVISSDIANRLGEFATLKALGYGNGYLSRIVLQQALLQAVLGYLPGLTLSLALYEVTHWIAGIPIEMDLPRAVIVLALAIAMCAVSGLLALRKVQVADPAELF